MRSGEYWTLESTVARALSARRFTLAILTDFGAPTPGDRVLRAESWPG